MKYNQLLKFSSLFLVFANELEDKLKKPVGKSYSEDEKFLIRNNVIPIEIGGNTSFIDKGGFSNVYRVIWKGKPAVAKITEWENDFQKMIALASLRNKIPEKYQKHIPIVYDAINENNYKFAIIMEELHKTNSHVNEFIEKSCEPIIKEKILNLNQNLKYIAETFINLLRIPDTNQLKKYQSCIDDIVTYLQKKNLIFLNKERDYSIFDEVIYNVKENLFIFLTLNCRFDKSDAIFFSKQYFVLLHETFDFIKFPDSYSRKEGHFGDAPETQSLLECLRYLKNKFGIKWHDLYSSNIMERPGTRDLVISDPGQFEGL